MGCLKMILKHFQILSSSPEEVLTLVFRKKYIKYVKNEKIYVIINVFRSRCFSRFADMVPRER